MPRYHAKTANPSGSRTPKSIGYIEPMVCPVTSGRESRMTEATFRRMCFLKRQTDSRLCRKCAGKKLPAGLELVEMDSLKIWEETMTISRKPGTCEICGKEKNVERCHEKNVCSACAFVWRSAHNAPDNVVAALLEAQGREFLAGKVGIVDAQQGQQPDNERLVQLVQELTDKLNDAEREISACRKAAGIEDGLPLPEYIEVLMAAGKLNSRLTGILVEINDRANLMNFESIPDFVNNLMAENQKLQEKFTAVENVGAYLRNMVNASEQVIETVRGLLDIGQDESIIVAVQGLQRERQKATDIWFETCGILGVDTSRCEDLPKVARQLNDDLIRSHETKPGRTAQAMPESRKDALLDLCLAVIAGEVQGLKAEHIDALR